MITHGPVQVTPPASLNYMTNPIPVQHNGEYIAKAVRGTRVLGEIATNFCEFIYYYHYHSSSCGGL